MRRDDATRANRIDVTAAGLIYRAMKGDANRIMDEMEEYPDVEILQDWEQGTTTYRFGDGSALTVDGPTVMEKPMTVTLWWVSEDGSGDLNMGDYASATLAEAAIPEAMAELLEQCANDDERSGIRAGRWTVDTVLDMAQVGGGPNERE
jgi:hypothetical protein